MSTCINDYNTFGPLDIEELKKRYRISEKSEISL